MTSDPRQLLDTLQSAISRYRAHASRDPAWVQTWTGQPDPELLEIEQAIEQLSNLALTSSQLVELLDRLLAERDEALLAQAVTEALLAQKSDHADTLHAAIVERAVAIVQDFDEPSPAATPWLGQLLFWYATELEDLELAVALLGDEAQLVRAIPFWLSTSRADLHTHLFAHQPDQAMAWLGALFERLCGDFDDADVLQGLALAMGMTRHQAALPYITRILSGRLGRVPSPEAVVEPDVAIAASLEALGAIGTQQALEEELWLDVLNSPAHGDQAAALIASEGACHVPMLSSLLERTRHLPEAMHVRVRATRALKTMPAPAPQADRALEALVDDRMTPIRHMALYALITREVEGTIALLGDLLRQQRDEFEAEELLFILSSHPDPSAAELIGELGQQELPSQLDEELFLEAMAMWQSNRDK